MRILKGEFAPFSWIWNHIKPGTVKVKTILGPRTPCNIDVVNGGPLFGMWPWNLTILKSCCCAKQDVHLHFNLVCTRKAKTLNALRAFSSFFLVFVDTVEKLWRIFFLRYDTKFFVFNRGGINAMAGSKWEKQSQIIFEQLQRSSGQWLESEHYKKYLRLGYNQVHIFNSSDYNLVIVISPTGQLGMYGLLS